VRTAVLILTAMLSLACSANPHKRVPRAAAVAMTGSPQTVVDISPMLMVEGIGETFNLGQNQSPDAELPKFTVTRYQRVMQFGTGRWRQDLTRVPTFITANTSPQRQITALDGTIGFNVTPDGTSSRVSPQVALERHAELYHHPLGFLRAVFTQTGQVSNTRMEGTAEAVDMTVDGETFTMYINAETKLPEKITSRVHHANLGDVVMETAFADYMTVQGHQMPGRLTTRIDKYVVSDIMLRQQSLSGNFGDLAAPLSVSSETPPDQSAVVNVEEISPGVWYLTGESHHSVLVEFADHLALVEAPQNDERTLAVIRKARELRPAKPLKYLVNTHHHFDHSGGIRAAVSEGLTIVTQQGNRAFLEDIVARRHTMRPDALATTEKPLLLETVQDKHVLRDAMRTLELYRVESPHSASMLIGYLPAERILIEADLYTPPAPNAAPPISYPFVTALSESIRMHNLAVTRLLPIHGVTVPLSNLEVAVQKESLRARLANSD
jgi:glyoxylase-like metal-dependent hydrolase (beta-lactamase superfamily II)